MVVENVNGALIPAVFAFLINLIREMIKDMEDIKGDKLAGVNTFPIKYGSKACKIFRVDILINIVYVYLCSVFISYL